MISLLGKKKNKGTRGRAENIPHCGKKGNIEMGLKEERLGDSGMGRG